MLWGDTSLVGPEAPGCLNSTRLRGSHAVRMFDVDFYAWRLYRLDHVQIIQCGECRQWLYRALDTKGLCSFWLLVGAFVRVCVWRA